MRSGSMVVPIMIGLLALGLVMWLMPNERTVPTNKTPPAKSDDGVPEGAPELSAQGPHPKAVVEETEHDFDMMMLGTEKSHKFLIENKGEAPLKLFKGKTTCKCTLSDLAQEEIPSGEQAEIELTWTPKSMSNEFRQTATIWTNDPDQRSIVLGVRGSVIEVLTLKPESPWQVGTLKENEEKVVKGKIFSRLQPFKITKVETGNDKIEVDVQPFTDADKEEYEATEGYQIRVTIKAGYAYEPPEETVQPNEYANFQQPVVLHTDIALHPELTFSLSGDREAPYQFRPLGGVNWLDNSHVLNLGTVPVDKAKSAALLLDIREFGETDLKINEITISDSELTVAHEEDEGFAENAVQRRFKLTLNLSPGRKAVAYRRDNPVEVTLKTNHPKKALQELTFRVLFVSLP